MSPETRKILETGMLQSFEPKRSRCVKHFSRNGLSYQVQDLVRARESAPKQTQFGAISTIRGTR